MQTTTPRYRIANIGAGSGEHRMTRERNPNPNLRGERLLPPDIVYIHAGLDLSDYTPEGVEEAFTRYWPCVEQVMNENPDRIGWSGFPLSPQLGRPGCLELIEETTRRTGKPAGSDVEAVVAALQYLGAQRVAVASRWKEQLNQAIVRYFHHAGIEVLAITSAAQMGPEAFSMSLDMGVRLVFQLSREAIKLAPEAEALIVPGGTWPSLGAVPIIEEDCGIPVVTNGTAQAWRLMHDGIAPPVRGWGRLLESP